ncbi:MAG: hypothetical protein JW902_05430 [Syntrophaceae bacterium]|nr:hypothetical protein [Syntrophaceae bacterium]
MKIFYNPFPIFRSSRTPAGLYARQKWLGDSAEPGWQKDFQETVRALLNGQSGDGSWHQSSFETVRRLFGLHLTIRDINSAIADALHWLTALASSDDFIREETSEGISLDLLRELPFTAGQSRLTLICATLFLSTIFHQHDDPAVMACYGNLSRRIIGSKGDILSWGDRSNLLRAFVVHPRYANDVATAALVDVLAEVQDASGCWPEPIPFFQIVNALAHLRDRTSNHQWNKALPFIINTQNIDGSWGDDDREWNTFLVVHALRNKGCL